MTNPPEASPSLPLITDVAMARAAMRLLFPKSDRINRAIDERRKIWIEQLDLNRAGLTEEQRKNKHILLSTVDAGLLFNANMAGRYGSGANDFDWDAYDNLNARLESEGHTGLPGSLKQIYLPYHQEEHLIWMWERLTEIYREYDFPLQRCCVLSSSVGPHDLVQLVSGIRGEGIGWSEWLSADEARHLMLAGGFEAEADANLIDRVMLNIYGTTFSFDETAGHLGALAPKLIPRIQEKYKDCENSSQADEEIQDLLLTSDVDTSALTDFTEYTKTAALLCREVFVARQGCEQLPPLPAFKFLTGTQRRFLELQSFQSHYALELLQPRKEKTIPLMDELIYWMEQKFENPEGDFLIDQHGKHIDDGEIVLQEFLARADVIRSGRGSGP